MNPEEDDHLDPYYDVIVLGTGLSEAIVAAALAKSGKTVLHLDEYAYYGGDNASFPFVQLLEWADDVRGGRYSRRAARLDAIRGGNRGTSANMPIPPPSSASTSSELMVADGLVNGTAFSDAIGKARAWRQYHARLRQEEKLAAATAAAVTVAAAADAKAAASGESSSPSAVAAALGGPAPEGTAEEGGENEGAADSPKADDGIVGSGGEGDADAAKVPPPELVARTIAAMGTLHAVPLCYDVGGLRILDESARYAPKPVAKIPETTSLLQTPPDQSFAGDDALDTMGIDVKLAKESLEFVSLDALQPSQPAAGVSTAPDPNVKAPLSAAAVEAGPSGSERMLAPPEGNARAGVEGARSAEAESQGALETAAAATVVISGHSSEDGADGGEGAAKDPREAEWKELVRRSRDFNIDLCPQMLLSAGPALHAFFGAGIVRYLEFESVEALCIAQDGESSSKNAAAEAAPPNGFNTNVCPQKTSSSSTGSGDCGSGGGDCPLPLHVWRVPCSKSDVFGSQALSMLEKRRLMQLLQLCLDWGVRYQERVDVLSRNETAALHVGRSLQRPQNKGDATVGDPLDALGFEAAGRPFQEFLAHAKLSPRLQSLVTHVLALPPPLPAAVAGSTGTAAATAAAAAAAAGVPAGIDTGAGLRGVWRHLSSLGRFGNTAFLAPPLYGSGELSGCFCRTAAVWGAIYILRRSVTALLVEEGGSADGSDLSADGGAGDDAVADGDAEAAGGGKGQRCVGVVDDTGRVIGCGAVVMSDAYRCESFNAASGVPAAVTGSATATALDSSGNGADIMLALRTLRRVSIVDGSVLPGLARAAIVLPPGLAGIGNAAAIHVLQLDETLKVTPPNSGLFLLHLSTTDLAPVEIPAASANSDGRSAGTAGGDGAQHDSGGGESVPATDAGAAMLGAAAARLLVGTGARELWSLMWCHDLPPTDVWRRYVDGELHQGQSAAPAPVPPPPLPPNVAICSRLPPELYLHGAAVQAAAVFARLGGGAKVFESPPGAPAAADSDDEAEESLMAAAVTAATVMVPEVAPEGVADAAAATAVTETAQVTAAG